MKNAHIQYFIYSFINLFLLMLNNNSNFILPKKIHLICLK